MKECTATKPEPDPKARNLRRCGEKGCPVEHLRDWDGDAPYRSVLGSLRNEGYCLANRLCRGGETGSVQKSGDGRTRVGEVKPLSR